MTGKTAAGWHTYEDVGQVVSELDLTGEDMAWPSPTSTTSDNRASPSNPPPS